MRLLDWPRIAPRYLPAAELLCGLALAGGQVFLFIRYGMLSAWAIGGGIAFILMGLMSWYYLREDRRAGVIETRKEELPTAEEYDQWFEQTESGAGEDDPHHA